MVTIRSAADVDTVVREALHFAPKDSLVVVPVGGNGPFARVDLGPADGLAAAFAAALPHWSRVIVAIYGDSPAPIDLAHVLPGVEILLVVDFPNPEPGAFTRDDLAALAAHVETAEEAERAAWEAYQAGDGALAWTYLDRAEALGGLSTVGAMIGALIAGAVDPRG